MFLTAVLLLGVTLVVEGVGDEALSVSAATVAPASVPQTGLSLQSTPTFGTATTISAGALHTCALSNDSVFCWGSGIDGQLGIDESGMVSREVPAVVLNSADNAFTNTNVTAVSAGALHTCAIQSGKLFCWGNNENGQLGDNSTTNRLTPVAVATSAADAFTNTNVTAVSAGRRHTCAIENRSVFCWGRNVKSETGQLGTGSAVNKTLPEAVSVTADVPGFQNTNVTAVSAANVHTCAIEGGTVFCWGVNGIYGRMGTGLNNDPFVGSTAVTVSVTSAVPGFQNTNVTAVSAADIHTCAIEGGAVFCWGSGSDHRLGNGSPNVQLSPVTVSATSDVPGFTNTNVSAVAAGGSEQSSGHTCAIEDSSVFCWGSRTDGAVGDGLSSGIQETPVTVSASGLFANSAVTTLALRSHDGMPYRAPRGSCAIEDGKAFCWGMNSMGATGNLLGARSSDPFSALPLRVDPPFISFTGMASLTVNTGAGITPVDFTANGLAEPVTFTLVETDGATLATLPTGLQFTSSGTVASISGTPTATLTQTCFKVRGQSGADDVVSDCVNLTVETLPPGFGSHQSFRRTTVGTPITPLDIPTQGMTGPVTFTAVNFMGVGATGPNNLTGLGALHAGLSIVTTSATAAQIVGTPTESGFASFKIQAVDGATTVVTPLSIIIEVLSGGGGGGGGGTGFGGGGGVAPVVNTPAPTPAAPLAPAGPAVLSPPAAGAAPSLVTAEDAARVQQAPGAGGVRVNGAVVTAAVARVDVPAAEVAPEDRTPEQVASVQEAAAELVASFTADAPAGAAPLVTVTNTDTGAVVNGVVVDPRDGVTPVPVPAEDVVLLSAAETRVLFAAASGEAVPAEAPGAVLEVSEGGVISAVAYGFPASVPGEVVIFSTPTLLGTFTIGDDGSFAGQLGIPEGLEAGEHTLVLTAGGVTTSLGLVVAGDGSTEIVPQPEVGTLPATGADHDPAWLVLLLAIGGLMVLVSRRRYV